MSIINLTPHAINFDNGAVIAPSGHVARLDITLVGDDDIDGVPVVSRYIGIKPIVGLPDTLDKYASVIVSAQCADALGQQCPDLTVYTVGQVTRHPDGRVTTANLVLN